MAKPFIKWAGGKKYLLPEIDNILNGFDCSQYDYQEPMVGGGAVLYHIGHRFRSITISDINIELINLYNIIKQNCAELIIELKSGKYHYHHKSEQITVDNYYRIRSSEPANNIERAARILYLLKTCFNGLMRTNKSGKFNTPMGSYTDPTVCDETLLNDCSTYLQNVKILGPMDAAEFISNNSSKSTFLFIDPPYHNPGTNNGGKFSDYSGEFGETEQTKLIETMLESGAKFIYTNRATEFILSHFDKAIKYKTVPLRHSIQPKYTTNLADESELIAYRL